MIDLLHHLQISAIQQHYGAAFLLAYGIAWLICGGVAFYVSDKKAALAVIFQGAVALPFAFLLMYLLHIPTTDSNPLVNQLAVYLAIDQVLALPLVIYLYAKNPAYVPIAFATILGMHFLPYVWLDQTKVYFFLSIAIVCGGWIIMRLKKDRGARYVSLYTGILLLGGGVYLFFR